MPGSGALCGCSESLQSLQRQFLGRSAGNHPAAFQFHQRDHGGVVAGLDRLVGVGVAGRVGRAALGVPRGVRAEQPVQLGRDRGRDRVKLQVGQRGQVTAVDERGALALQADADPEPASRAAARPIRPRSTLSLNRTTRPAQPSSSRPASISRSTSVTASPDRHRHTSRPTAGETPMTTSRGPVTGPGRANSSEQRNGEARLLRPQVGHPPGLPDRVDLALPGRGGRVPVPGPA